MPSIKQLYEISPTLLGKGSFAEVRYGKERATGREVAIKVMNKKTVRQDLETVVREASIMQNCEHENIIRLYGFYESSNNVYIVTELAKGGELFDHIVKRRFYSEEDARALIKQLVSAVCYIHSKGIVHLDIKPENLLLKEVPPDYSNPNTTDETVKHFVPCIKLADFGLSQIMGNGRVLANCAGTMGYVAPEVLLGRPYTTSPDIYSVGVVTYVLLAGFMPIDEKDFNLTAKRVVAGDWKFISPYFDGISDQAKDFIRRCMAVDPARRMTAAEAMKHPWLNESASVLPLAGTQAQLRRYVAKLRLKAGFTTMAAASRIAALNSALKGVGNSVGVGELAAAEAPVDESATE